MKKIFYTRYALALLISGFGFISLLLNYPLILAIILFPLSTFVLNFNVDSNRKYSNREVRNFLIIFVAVFVIMFLGSIYFDKNSSAEIQRIGNIILHNPIILLSLWLLYILSLFRRYQKEKRTNSQIVSN
jgi:hypothetical protein